MGWSHALFIVNTLCIGLIGVVAAGWFGYRKYTGPKAKKAYASFLLGLFGGGAVGAVIGALDSGKALSELGARKLGLLFGLVTLVGIALSALIAVIAYLRNRDAMQGMALLKADAESERLARHGAQAELKLLQAQVEPHFLFNTLANLRFLVQTQSPQALTMLDHLIHYLRTALPEIRAESSTVGREIELARAYLEILRIRMGGALAVEAGGPPELMDAGFPPLIVLTLVENAIKHGIAPLGKGRVSVQASASGGRLRVTVEDDGRGLGEPIGQGVGLRNVRERLRAIYGETARLDLEQRPGGGAIASVEVPL
jgi:sensor histidine kinase YesM